MRTFLAFVLLLWPACASDITDPAWLAGLDEVTLPKTDLVSWHRADSLFLSVGTAVTTWPDSSGNGHSMVSASGPFWTNNASLIKRKPWLQFGGGVGMENDELIQSQPCTLFVLAYLGTRDSDWEFLWDGTNASGRMILYLQNLSPMKARWNVGTDLSATNLFPTNVWTILEATANGSTSTYYQDGVLESSGTGGTNQLWGISLGKRYSAPSYYYNGGIAEIILYSGDLASETREAVRSYLTNKYGL